MTSGQQTLAYAHSLEHQPCSEWEPLEVHLKRVAELAACFAHAFDGAEWGRVAGWWHDLGKYQPQFQRRLHGSGEQIEHAGVGAALAAERDLLPIAFAIAGHHAGLPNLRAQNETAIRPLRERVATNQEALEALRPLVEPYVAEPAAALSLPPWLERASHRTEQSEGMRGLEFWTRMLFSALVDADFLATEAFYESGRRSAHPPFDDLAELQRRLDRVTAQFVADSPVNRLRHEILMACQQQAGLPPGLFSLTVPTGGGKTLSGMSFALHHGVQHDLRRVIVVIPYTSITEQNAAVYRQVFDTKNVIEHHSGFDEQQAQERNPQLELRRRLACENWDAPVIVTTTVQLFESLLTNRPSRCRKLHNIARSVIILDEVQALPSPYLLTILDVLRELTEHYGCSVVLSTATPPALEQRPGLSQGLTGVRPIIQQPSVLADQLQRVRVTWPADPECSTPYEQVAGELVDHEQVLCIVHRRQDARELAQRLPEEGRFHLSALMCPAHRLKVLGQVAEALEQGQLCRLVATQLIEAGVDIDFPVVYRALAGLDSIAQAAGRCNREGHLAMGQVHVFRAETQPPAGTLRKGLETTAALLKQHGGELNPTRPEHFETYFRMLYSKENLDAKGIQSERPQLNFATVAEHFHLIEDGYQQPVVVPYGDAAERVDAFRTEPSREHLRALQPYTVQITQREYDLLKDMGGLENLHERVDILCAPAEHLYGPQFGLVVTDASGIDPNAMVV